MEGNCPFRSEGQGSAKESSKPADHPVYFTASTIRLHRASAERYKAARPGWQPVGLDQGTEPEAGASRRTAAGGFCLLDESSKGPMPSIAKLPGLMSFPAAESRKGALEDFAISYSLMPGGQPDEGVVPLITVGSVFTLLKMRLQVAPLAMPEAGHLWQALSWHVQSSPKKDPLQWLLDGMLSQGIHTFFTKEPAVQGGKWAWWITRESAHQGRRSRDLFDPDHPADRLPDSHPDAAGSGGKRPMRGEERVRPRQEASLLKTVRKAFPRPPLFLLPKHYWLPGAKPPTEPAGESEPGYPAGSTVEAKVSIREWPLMSVINALRDKPPGAGFQLEPDDEKSALDTHAAWQRSQQYLEARNPEEAGMALEVSVDSISTGAVRSGVRQEPGRIRRGELPVFKLPGFNIRLPTIVGMVSFSPLFLSKEQLNRTWGQIQAAHRWWLMRQRRSERRQLRLSIERVAAGLAGVRAGSAPPPATASAARPGEEEDEEGMDEPPEVKQFLQELGEGGRATPEPGLPEDGLPASGVGLVVASCATGTLSLGLRCIEQMCNQADRLISLTPVGRRALGFLPDPRISVHSLGALAARTNAQNVRILYDLDEQGAFGPNWDRQADSREQEASSVDSVDAQSAAGEQGPAGLSESNVRDGRIPQEQDDILKRGSYRGDGMSDGAAGDASSADNIISTDALRQGRHKASRLGAFFGRLRRRKTPPPVQLSQSSESDPPDVKPQSSDECPSDTLQHAVSPEAQPYETGAAGQNVPRQLGESSPSRAQDGEHSRGNEYDAEQHAASSPVTPEALKGGEGSSKRAAAALRAPMDHASSSAAGDGSALELQDMRLDWDMMNESIQHSLHSFVTTATTALILQSLGMQVFDISDLKRPKGRSRGTLGHQQEQDDSSGGAESDAPEQMSLVFSPEKMAGVAMDDDDEEEKKTLQGLLLVGNLPRYGEVPWEIPSVGCGNGAHLAWSGLRCAADARL